MVVALALLYGALRWKVILYSLFSSGSLVFEIIVILFDSSASHDDTLKSPLLSLSYPENLAHA